MRKWAQTQKGDEDSPKDSVMLKINLMARLINFYAQDFVSS